LAFGEEDIHRMRGREALSRSHNDLNMTDDMMWAFSTPPELRYTQDFKTFVFRTSFGGTRV
jgi:hypothetical protein